LFTHKEDKLKIPEKITDIAKAAAVISAAILIIVYPSETATATIQSIDVCISSIIPSMFAFMVISSYTQASGIYKTVFRPVLFIFRRLINADDSITSVFLLSLFGGYPIGVKLLSEIIAQNKNSPAIKSTAENSAMFCYCISPTFAIIMIGSGVFGSTEAGVLIYLSNVLSCLVTAVIISRITSLKCEVTVNAEKKSITDSINSASRSLFVICTVIIAFNTVLACISGLMRDIGYNADPLLFGLFEVSNLLRLPAVTIAAIPIISAIASFGGMCVLLQCTAIVKNVFSVKKFLLARIPCSLLSGVFSYVILQFTDISVTASTISPGYSFSFSADKIIILILIAMCIIIFNKYDKILKKV